MNEKLTPEEIKIASKYINRYEKDVKVMKFGRWIVLLISLALISSSFYLLLQSQKIGKINTAEYILEDKKLELNILDRYIDARLEGKKLKTDILSKYINARIDLLRIKFEAALKSYIGAILGGLMIGCFIATCMLNFDGVRNGKMLGLSAYYAGKKLCVCIYENGVGLKVPEKQAKQLLKDKNIKPFQPMGKPKMREWIQIDLKNSKDYMKYEEVFECSVNYVNSLQK